MAEQSNTPLKPQPMRPLALLMAALLSGANPWATYAQTVVPDVNEAAAALAESAPPAGPDAMAPATLEELLAPIAIYPDSLLGAMFSAASNPQEVMDAGNWRLQNKGLVGRELDAAALKAGFGPSARTLLAFPKVLDMMCQNFEWTKRLGAAFNADQGALMAAVQRLRAQAVEAGNLGSTPEQKVSQRNVDGQQVLEIVPTNPRVVYVPQYDPVAVYTAPAPVQVQYVPVPAQLGVTEVYLEPRPDTSDLVVAGLIGFAAGIVLVNTFVDTRPTYVDPWYDPWPCPQPRWGRGYLYYDDQPWVAYDHDYRPRYESGFPRGYHGGDDYRPPPDYPYGWHRPGGWDGPTELRQRHMLANVHGRQADYFDRFNDRRGQDTNHQPAPPVLVKPVVRQRVDAGYRPPRQPPVVRPVTASGGPRQSSPDWRGHGSYDGPRSPEDPRAKPGRDPRAVPSTGVGAPTDARGQSLYRGPQPGFGGRMPPDAGPGVDVRGRNVAPIPSGAQTGPASARSNGLGPRPQAPALRPETRPLNQPYDSPLPRGALGTGFAPDAGTGEDVGTRARNGVPAVPDPRTYPAAERSNGVVPRPQAPASRADPRPFNKPYDSPLPRGALGTGFAPDNVTAPRSIVRLSPPPVANPAPRPEPRLQSPPPSMPMPMPRQPEARPVYAAPQFRPPTAMAAPPRERAEPRPAPRMFAAPPAPMTPRSDQAPRAVVGASPRQEAAPRNARGRGQDDD